MSIYSGFATRALETTYNKTLCEILQVMQRYLMMSIKKGKNQADSSLFSGFAPKFSKLFNSLKGLEQQKHLKPMFSLFLSDISEFIQRNLSDFELSLEKDSFVGSLHSFDQDFQILNDGLAYDDTRVHKFLPSKLQTVLEKPNTRNYSREKTSKLTSSKHSSPDVKIMKNDVIFKKLKKRMNKVKDFQNRALTRLDQDYSKYEL